jgi:hypothetical protein
VKLLEREADHSPPSNDEAKNAGAIPQLPQTYSYHNTKLIGHMNNFIFIVTEGFTKTMKRKSYQLAFQRRV